MKSEDALAGSEEQSRPRGWPGALPAACFPEGASGQDPAPVASLMAGVPWPLLSPTAFLRGEGGWKKWVREAVGLGPPAVLGPAHRSLAALT